MTKHKGRSRGALWCMAVLALSFLGACDGTDGASKPAPPGSDKPVADNKPAKVAPKETAKAEVQEPEVDESQWSYLIFPDKNVKKGVLSKAEEEQAWKLSKALPERNSVILLAAHGHGIKPIIERLLEDENPARRASGVRLVQYLMFSDFYDKVSTMLEDADERVRAAGVETLGRFGNDKQANALNTSIKKSSFTLYLRMIRILSERNDRALVDHARKVYERQRRVAQLRALQALAEVAMPQDFAWFASEVKKLHNISMYDSHWEALSVSPEKAVKLARKTFAKELKGNRELTFEEERNFHTALRVLAPWMGKEVLAEYDRIRKVHPNKPFPRRLLQGALLLDDPRSEEVAAEASKSRALHCEVINAPLQMESHYAKRVDLLKKGLANPEKGAKIKEIQASLDTFEAELKRINPKVDKAFVDLGKALRSGKFGCRATTGDMIPQRRQALLAFLQDKDPVVRAEVARILAKHRDRKSIDALASLLRDEDKDVRALSRQGLRRILGADIRFKDGFGWESWYRRSIGPLPASAHPVKSWRAVHSDEIGRDLKARPWSPPRISSTDASDGGGTGSMPGIIPGMRPAGATSRPAVPGMPKPNKGKAGKKPGKKQPRKPPSAPKSKKH